METGPGEERDVPRLFPPLPGGLAAATAAQLQGRRLAPRPALTCLPQAAGLATPHGQPEHLCGKGEPYSFGVERDCRTGFLGGRHFFWPA